MARYERLERTSADIRQENNRLREQLGFAETLALAHIPAQIIGRDPDNLFSALVINKGRREGLKNDMPVIAFQNGVEALMGKVSQAGALESLVLPIYDVNFFISARFSDSRYEGLVEGQGDREAPLLMRNIPKRAREEINYGDLVVSSGIGGVYPPGIVIGRVVQFHEYENAMTVELESALTFSRLEYVFVIDVESADG
jgi:rod shape-determining protein MreC